MAIKTTVEQLEEVQTAIAKVLSGQAYSIGNRSLTMADLDALHTREEVLLSRYRSEQSGGLIMTHGVRQR